MIMHQKWSFILLLLWITTLNAAPIAELIPFWNKSHDSNQTQINHHMWQHILDRYLEAKHPSGINRFNYAKLAKNAFDKKKLNQYLSYLQGLKPRQYSKKEQKAYWINLYNALTIQIVLNAYPVKSISKIHEGWFAFGPWNDIHATVEGQKLSLNNIEHGILRPIWRDNRIHYAVNCASIGCPNLAPQAYTAHNMETSLDKAAQDYINHQRGVQFKNGRFLLSRIYDWYKVDFGRTHSNIIKHLQQYANANLSKRLRSYQGTFDYNYDWTLNKP